MQKQKCIFLGTPSIAKTCLEKLLSDDQFKVVGVITQPDRPRGRKMKLQPCEVKAFAEDKRIPVISPESINSEAVIEQIKQWNADVAIVVAFGQLLGDEVLSLFPNKIVNVHTSLLPRWRGAAPIQRAIMAGDLQTGVCLQLMVKKLDAGDVIGFRETEITDSKDALTLHDELAELGSEIISNEFISFLKGDIVPTKQDETKVTYAKKLQKTEALIDWGQPARVIFNRMRGLKLGPGSFTYFAGKKLKIHEAIPVEGVTVPMPVGEVVSVETSSFNVQCGEKSQLQINLVQPESKAKMSSGDFIRGYGLKQGDVFGGE